MVERMIEQRIVEKIKGLNIQGLQVCGLWDYSLNIMTSNEKSNSKGFLVVKVPTRGFDTYGICEVQFDIVLSLVIRLDMCPTGKEMEQMTKPILKMLTDWNLVDRGDDLSDFMVDGFYPGGIQVNQGQGPDIDKETKTWATTFNIVLRGTIDCDCH